MLTQLLIPQNLSCPLVPMKNWFQEPLLVPKSANTKVFYIKYHRSMHTVGLPYLWTPNQEWKTVQVFIKKETWAKWAGAIQVHFVQVSTEYIYITL